jgi:soluble lytic murein transglycosylase-like protein
MRSVLAAFSAACLCVSAFSAGMAHAEPTRGSQKKHYQAETSAKEEASKTKPVKTSTKRVKRKGAVREEVVSIGKLKTFSSTTGYAKADNPVTAPATGYSGLIQTYAKAYGVPVDLAHAVVRVESNFNPRARGSAGEIGLMQIKPATARMMGYQGGAKGLYDPETNIKFGMKYLAMAHDLGGGTTCGTILKYNAGHGAKRMNPVSKRYCGKIRSIID